MKKLALFISILTLTSNAFAEKKLEHLFEEWHVITDVKEGEKICYIASLASEEEGNVTRATDPYLLVSKFEQRKPEVSVSSGFSYKEGGEVKFMIKEKVFLLDKIQNNIAWAKNNVLDAEIIAAMKAGAMLDVKSTSQDGKYAIESYSLKGFTNAYNKMLDVCENLVVKEVNQASEAENAVAEKVNEVAEEDVSEIIEETKENIEGNIGNESEEATILPVQ